MTTVNPQTTLGALEPKSEELLLAALRRLDIRASHEDIAVVANQLTVLSMGLTQLRSRVRDGRDQPAARRSASARRLPLQTIATSADSGAVTEPWYMSVDALHRGYLKRTLSPVEVVGATLERIGTVDRKLQAYVTVMADSATIAAKQSESRMMRGAPLGPLDGIPTGIKDLFDTRAVRTTGGCPLFAHRVPAADSAVVQRLRRAGAIIIGKQTLDELGIGYVRENGVVPVPLNPWNASLSPGGSSSGSAVATAAGLSTVAIGTDTGGSVRYPAACCGVVGLKPTNGLIDMSGCIPYSPALDQGGPLARNVQDVVLTLRAVAGLRSRAGTQKLRVGEIAVADLRGLRIAAPTRFVESLPDLQPDTLASYKETLAYFTSNSAFVEEIELPDLDIEPTAYATIVNAEGFAGYESALSKSPEGFGASAFRRLLVGAGLSAADYVVATAARNLLQAEMEAVMRTFDVVVLPTADHIAWTDDKDPQLPGWLRPSLRHLFNISGQPAVSVPAGFSEEGAPIGVQFAGNWFHDEDLLAIAARYEHDHGQREQRPRLD